MRTSTALFPWIVGVLVTAATAAPQGGSREHFPPDPQVDWKHVRLQLTIPDLGSPRFGAKAEWTFVDTGTPAPTLRLDAGRFTIASVRQVAPVERVLEWTHQDEVLEIRRPDGGFGKDTPAATPIKIEIDYSVSAPVSGMVFSPATPGVDGRPPQAAEIHTQGEATFNHHWFPVHDFPNIRMSSEVLVDVPKGISVSSNGRLVAHETVGERERWHWLQEKPHVPYLVSVVAGNFQRTALPAPLSGVPMAVWTLPADAGLAGATYGRTDAMIACFEERFGIKYPWDRYDQLVVRNFGAGGMENTSVTTMHPGAILDETALLEADLDGLISHELCHQWTGDLVTCRSWEHIWLNEGWATYGTALWDECHEGADAYFDSVLGSFGVARGDTGVTGKDPVQPTRPMCGRSYSSPGDTFGGAASPYPKGASILHMLRRKLGEEVFFRGVDLYFDRYALKLAETDDFRHCLEEVSYLSLEGFFQQWCYTPGCPRVKVAGSYDTGSRILTLTVTQGDRAPGLPPFAFDLPVVVRTPGGDRTTTISCAASSVVRQVELDGPPTMIAVDPWLDVLKVLEVDLPTPMLIEEASKGPTSASRRMAMRALGARPDAATRAALDAIARNVEVRWVERVEAVEAATAQGTPEARAICRALFDELVAPTLGASATEAAARCHPKLREALVQSVAVVPITEALPRLVRVAQEDRGYSPRVEAIKGIARLGSVDAPADREVIVKDPAVLAIMQKALEERTPQERIRAAAVDAVGRLGLVACLDQCEKLSGLGYADRLRPSAIEALSQLASSADAAQKQRIVALLIGYLKDPESRPREAAGEALVTLKAPEAVSTLQDLAKGAPSDRITDRAKGWLKRIQP